MTVSLPGRLGRIKVYLNDGYWTRILLPGFRYEPDLEGVLFRCLGKGVYFIDCGANIGYWSIIASAFTDRSGTVAVEPAPDIYKRLSDNAEENGRRFETIQAAVWSDDASGLSIVTHNALHAGSSVVNWNEHAGRPGYSVHRVPSVTLDRIFDKFCSDRDRPIVIKLDVEGAEVPALAGLKAGRNRDVLFIYEDHGSDPTCRATAAFLDEGFEVFAIDGDRIASAGIEDVRRIKQLSWKGYNFVACKPRSAFRSLLGVN